MSVQSDTDRARLVIAHGASTPCHELLSRLTEIGLQCQQIARPPDRPYKPAVPVEVAYRILEQEAQRGLLDDLAVQVFFEAGVRACLDGMHYPQSTEQGGPAFHHHVCDFDLHRSLDETGRFDLNADGRR